jgi:hypothetical protein
MALVLDPKFRYLRLRVRGEEKEAPTAQELANFVYDFNLLYEILRLALDKQYATYRFSYLTNYRGGRRIIDPEDRLYVDSLQLGSPVDATFVLMLIAGVGGGAGAVWAVVQTAEKIYNMPLNRRKLKAEVEKLENENAKARQSQFEFDQRELLDQLNSREATRLYDAVTKRLKTSPIQLSSLDIEIIPSRHRDEKNKR